MSTEFQNKVYSLARKIPKGKVSTYGEISRALGNNSYRAVGNALNKNPFLKNGKNHVPCHRVVKSNGSVGGYARGSENKIKILKKEGVQIKNNKINLKRYGFRLKK